MGACNSAANYETNDNGKPIRDTEGALLNNQEYLSIDQWSCDNVYQWLSTVDNGELKELANKFKNERIKGKVLDSVCDEQLKEMGANIGDRLQFKKARLTLFKDHNYHSPFIEQQQHQQQQTQSHISSRPPLPLHPSRASNESYPSVGNTSGQSNGARMNQNTSFNHSHGHNHNNHSHHHRQQSINTKSMNPPGCNPHQQPQQQQPQPSQHATFDVVASMPGGFPPQTSLQFGDSSQDKSQDLFQQDPTYAAIDINDLNVNGIVNGEEGDLNYMKNNLVNNLINNNVSNKSNKSNKSNSNSNNTNSMSQIIADTKDASDGDMGKCSTNQQAKIKYGPRGLIKNKNKTLSKPGLDRSGSVPVNGDMYPRPISNGSFTNLQNHKHPHSHSNPVYNNHSNPVKHNNHKYNNGYYNVCNSVLLLFAAYNL